MISARQRDATGYLTRVKCCQLPAALSIYRHFATEFISRHRLRFLCSNTDNHIITNTFLTIIVMFCKRTSRSLSLAANMTESTFSVVWFIISVREKGVDGKEAGESAPSIRSATYSRQGCC